MKIVYLNYEDKVGRRFNGYDLMLKYNSDGHDVTMSVWEKSSTEKKVKRNFDFFKRRYLRGLGIKVDRYLGLPAMAYPFQLIWQKFFLKSDIVHIQLMNNYYFNIFELPIISWLKPTVLTIHEFSPLTSHCVYPPSNCHKWEVGCYSCPDRMRLFPLYRRTEALIWIIKKFVYKISNIHIVVASKWMLDKVEKSPLLNRFPISIIPFGVNLKLFSPPTENEKSLIRKKLDIPEDYVVISFRAIDSPFKGIPTILKALERLDLEKICILTFQEKGMCNYLKNKFKIIDMGLIKDEELMASAYKASDIFLMPSSNETFGMMALEAMATGLSVIVTKGTPLEEIGNSPDSSISIDIGNDEQLHDALVDLCTDRNLRKNYGDKARKFVVENFNFDNHSSSMLSLYRKLVDARRKV